MAQFLHRLVRDMTGVADPYRAHKHRFNQFAMGMLPDMRRRIALSPDPRHTALMLAVAGNIIDFGPREHLHESDVRQAIDDAMASPLDEQAAAFWRAVDHASNILYLTDNAGEIVFDRLLIEHMPADRITLAVRGRPVLNDATMEDAQYAGLTDLVHVIDNGSDAPGTILEDCSSPFRAAFAAADMVIAKGQGNYETLSDEAKNIFFILKAKCPVVARDLMCQTHALVVQPADVLHCSE
jgi:uncharacterized protein with ATP-grasp and redox domains